jgi:ferric-dicitrate binding protein FerR (iron transport regulator)
MGSQAVYHKKSGVIEQGKFQNENFLSWKTAILRFRDAPLSRVFEELSEYYHIPIVTEDQSILRHRITTTCEGQPLEEVLSELSFHHDLRFNHRNDTIHVLRKTP